VADLKSLTGVEAMYGAKQLMLFSEDFWRLRLFLPLPCWCRTNGEFNNIEGENVNWLVEISSNALLSSVGIDGDGVSNSELCIKCVYTRVLMYNSIPFFFLEYTAHVSLVTGY